MSISKDHKIEHTSDDVVEPMREFAEEASVQIRDLRMRVVLHHYSASHLS